MLTVADIYCGAGGLSAGFELANEGSTLQREQGFKIAYGVDRDPDAIRSFRRFHFANLTPEQAEIAAPCSDIADITADQILKAISPNSRLDVLIGGPNCQGVSAAGLRNPEDDRNGMLKRFIEMVRDLAPSWFVIENVPGLTHRNNHELLAEIFRELEELGGYEVSGDVLLAADYGVPQFRYRLFIIGTNTGKPIRFPFPTHVSTNEGEQQNLINVAGYVTVKDAIGALVDIPPAVYDRKAQPDEDLNIDKPRNHHYFDIGQTNKRRISSVEPGKDWRSMPISLLPERFFATRCSDQKGAYGRLLWNWPAYTITNAVCNVTAGPFTHPDQDRMLTVREAARLQSFSDTHTFIGRLEAQYRQVGNAVPPKLGAAIGRSILMSHFGLAPAEEIGTVGRLNYSLISDSLAGLTKFPTLVKRNVAPVSAWRTKNYPVKKAGSITKTTKASSSWNAKKRPPDPRPEDTRRLRKLAKQPGNYRAAKRARAIVDFIDGKKKKEIVEKANVSAASVKRWVDGYFSEGLDGWRAHHTDLSENVNLNLSPKLLSKIERAQERVRRTLLSPRKNGHSPANDFKRLHMNGYLVGLAKRFGEKSVEDLIFEVEGKLGAGIGTVYVSDLLALADVVLDADL